VHQMGKGKGMDDEVEGGTIDCPGRDEMHHCISEVAGRLVVRTELSLNSR